MPTASIDDIDTQWSQPTGGTASLDDIAEKVSGTASFADVVGKVPKTEATLDTSNPFEDNSGSSSTPKTDEALNAIQKGVTSAISEVIPKSIGQGAQMLAGSVTPVTGAIQDISSTAKQLYGLSQGKSISEVSPSGKPYNQFTTEDWSKLVSQIGIQAAMAIPIFRELHGAAVPNVLRGEPLPFEPPPTVSRGPGTMAGDVSAAIQEQTVPEANARLATDQGPPAPSIEQATEPAPKIREPLSLDELRLMRERNDLQLQNDIAQRVTGATHPAVDERLNQIDEELTNIANRELQPQGEQPDAIEPSNAQMEGGGTALGVETRPGSDISQTGSSNNVVGEAQRAEARGNVQGEQPVAAGETVAPATSQEPNAPGLGIKSVFSAKGATDVLYEKAFDALQKGKTTISGVKDPILTRNRAAFDRGEIKSWQDLKVLEEGKGTGGITPEAQQRANAPQSITAELPESGINTQRLQDIYGKDAVIVTKGKSAEAWKAAGQADKRDPYAVLSQAQKRGMIAEPKDAPLLRAEHQRLLGAARQAFGTPEYAQRAQNAVDFANATKQVVHGPASDIMRGLQEADKPSYTSPADFDNIIRERIGRESNPKEQKTFSDIANELSNGDKEVQTQVEQAKKRVATYKPKETMAFEDAVDSIRKQIKELTAPCAM